MNELHIAYGALSLSICALGLSLMALMRADNVKLRKMERLLNEVRGDAVNSEDLYARLYEAVRKIRNRMNTDDARKKKKSEDGAPDPDEDPDGWLRHMNATHPQGVFTNKGAKP